MAGAARSGATDQVITRCIGRPMSVSRATIRARQVTRMASVSREEIPSRRLGQWRQVGEFSLRGRWRRRPECRLGRLVASTVVVRFSVVSGGKEAAAAPWKMPTIALRAC
jgi:hypothetical protein